MKSYDAEEPGSPLDLDTQETRSIKKSLRRIKKASRAFYLIASFVFFAALLLWIGGMGVIIAALAFPSMLASDIRIEPLLLLSVFLFGGVLLLIIGTARLIFHDMEKDKAPYTMNQVKRIRFISYLLFADVVLEAIFAPVLASAPAVGGIKFNLVVAGGYGGLIVPVNVGLLLAGIGFLCFSVVVEYGVLLQRLADETI